MKTLASITRHYPSFAAIKLQATSIIWSGLMVKYGPHTGLDVRMQEVGG